MLRRSQSDFMPCLLLRLLLKMAKRSLPLPTPRTEPRIQVDSTWTESWVDGTVATWCDICQDLSRYGMYGVWVDGMSRCTDMNRYDRYVIILNDILIIIDTLLFFNDLSTLCGSSGNHRPYSFIHWSSTKVCYLAHIQRQRRGQCAILSTCAAHCSTLWPSRLPSPSEGWKLIMKLHFSCTTN